MVFRAPASSLECCCFISDSEFLSGSDDGSIELWSVTRKKPTHLIKNAHAPSLLDCGHSYEENCTTTCHGGDIGNFEFCSNFHYALVFSCLIAFVYTLFMGIYL